MNVFTGTSGFAYKEWKGTFYPEDLPDAKMLAYYAEHFRAVEINNTFYRMPSEKVLLDWSAQVPEPFRFVLKTPRRITHIKRLKEVDDAVEYLLHASACLGEQRGPFLVQLPPNLKIEVERLKRFLGLLPPAVPVAFEFRHESWFDDSTYDALRAHNAALCIAHMEEEEGALQTPFVATADWGYLRLRKVQYAEGELEDWARRLRQQSWSAAFVFFKHEDEGTGPKLAKRFEQVLATGSTAS